MKWARMTAMWCVTLLGLLSAVAPMEASGQSRPQENAAAQSQPAKKPEREAWAIQTESQAVAKARKIVGLPVGDAPRLYAELVTLGEDNTPFLHDQIVGRPIWQVVIEDWKLQLKSAPPDEEDQHSRVFDVFIDPTNGHLLKASSRWPESVPAIAPEPSAASAEEQMPRSGLEKYLGFPDAPARVDLLRALDVVLKEGEGSPLLAKQIVAHYVMQTRMGCKPRAVWAITLRGIPPFQAAYPGVPEDARNHMRNIIDAATGKWLGAGTCPQPETAAPGSDAPEEQR